MRWIGRKRKQRVDRLEEPGSAADFTRNWMGRFQFAAIRFGFVLSDAHVAIGPAELGDGPNGKTYALRSPRLRGSGTLCVGGKRKVQRISENNQGNFPGRCWRSICWRFFRLEQENRCSVRPIEDRYADVSSTVRRIVGHDSRERAPDPRCRKAGRPSYVIPTPASSDVEALAPFHLSSGEHGR